MRLCLSKPPSMRNLAVYEEVVNEGKPQIDVAVNWSVTQPQISRIVRQVREWLIKNRATETTYSHEDHVWLANRDYCQQLVLAQQQAMTAFTDGLSTKCVATNHRDDR